MDIGSAAATAGTAGATISANMKLKPILMGAGMSPLLYSGASAITPRMRVIGHR